MNVYESMQRPFQTREEQDQLIHAYTSHTSLYNGLVKSFNKQKTSGRYSIDDCNAFYRQLFYDWKRSLSILIQQNLVKEKYRQQLNAVYRYICSFHPNTKDDVLHIIDYESIQDETLKKGLETFRWNSIGEYSGWNHIHSNFVNFRISEFQDIKHRIYINCDSTVTHKLLLRFVQKCNERKIPYYFKYDSYGDRDDNIVFYCGTEYLETCISILREIMREENLKEAVHHPPLCTASIDGWMGYGSEPQHEKGKELVSFNEKREALINKSIKTLSSAWILSHFNTKVNINGKLMSYKDVLIQCIVDETIKHYKSITPKTEFTRKSRGYSFDDLESDNLYDLLYDQATVYFNNILSYYINDKNYASIRVPFMNGELTFNSCILENVRRQQVQFCWDHSMTFREMLMKKIHSSAKNVGIDPDNLACDLYVVEELGKSASQKNSSTSYETQDSSQHATTSSSSKIYTSPNVGTSATSASTPPTRPSTVNSESSTKPSETTPRPRRTKSGYIYKPMTDDEIDASRKKIGLR